MAGQPKTRLSKGAARFVGPGVSPEDAEKIYGEWLNLRWYAENCNNPKLKGLMVAVSRGKVVATAADRLALSRKIEALGLDGKTTSYDLSLPVQDGKAPFQTLY
jgi:hypothetical protein